jgi:hypothetical protein
MQSTNWVTRVTGVLVILLAVAIVTRVVWALLAPALPLLVGLIILGTIAGICFRRRNHW